MNITRLSWKNIIAKPLNTGLSVLLFALSIGLIAFLALFNHQLINGLDRNLANIDLVIGAKGSPLQLILNSMYHIDAPNGNIPLAEAAPFLNPQHPLIAVSVPLSLGDSYGAYRIVGTTPSFLSFYGADQVDGEIFKNDFDALVGSVVAAKLHLHIGDAFHSTHGLLDDPDMAHDHGTAFVVRGILKQTGTVVDQLILCTPQSIWKVHEHDTAVALSETDSLHTHSHSETTHHHNDVAYQAMDQASAQMGTDSILAELRAQPEKEITSILVRFKNKTNIQSLNFLRNINSNTGLMAASPALELNRLYAMLGSGTDALQYLAYLIALVAAISIFISLYASLKERKYEMAILRVGGAGPGLLFRLILWEGLWISLLGLAIGLVSAHLGMQMAGEALERSYKYAFTGWIWIREEWWIVIGGLLIGILAALLPAIQGSRVNLHKTLAEG